MFIIQLPSARKLLLNPQSPLEESIYICTYKPLQTSLSVTIFSALKVNSLIIKSSDPLTMDSKIKREGLVVLIRPELHRSYLNKVLSNVQLPKISRYFKAGSDRSC